MTSREWWRDAVVYEVYIRSFDDSNGDGVGDLAGIRARLGYLADLGVDALWITPFYPSPMHDHGYDVADYCDVEPVFGTLAEFDSLLAEAHALGLRVIIDIVPNHTSSEHPWFRQALQGRDSAKRDWYIFRAPKQDGSPPNDWKSVFGGSAWALDHASGDYYLHLFDVTQPDLNWRNPAVVEAFDGILRFWLDRGVDGFRIDVAHALHKDAQLRDGDLNAWDQDEVFDVWRRWRSVQDDYADRMFVGEVFLYDMDRVAEYVGPDQLHQAFNFTVAKMPFHADEIRRTVSRSLELFLREGTTPTWVLSNHDIIRHATRFGGGPTGLRRGRAATALLLGLPGSPYLYQGEELGLEQSDVPPEARQDPIWLRSHVEGRDGCRTPMPWAADPPGFGFTRGRPWLPFDRAAAERNVATESTDRRSTLSFYRRALALRRGLLPALGEGVSWPAAPEDCVVVARPLAGGGRLVVALNASRRRRRIDVGPVEEVLLTSGGRPHADESGVDVPAETTVWVRT